MDDEERPERYRRQQIHQGEGNGTDGESTVRSKKSRTFQVNTRNVACPVFIGASDAPSTR